MRTQKKFDLLNEALINKMMEKYNITFNDIKSHRDENKNWIIDGKKWFDYYTLTSKEYDDFSVWAIELIRKKLGITKHAAQKDFEDWFLCYGLCVEDE